MQLPIEDIENGLKYLDEKYEFDDEKVSDFKNSFVDYINKDVFLPGLGTLMKGLRFLLTRHR